MTDEFILTVKYKGLTLDFKAQLVLKGCAHQFCIQLDETDVYFEPDEQREYRAVAMPGQNEKLLKRVDAELLKEIAIMLKTILT